MMYMTGNGIDKDERQGRAMLERGCPEKGSTGIDACRQLGGMYEKGKGGVKKDGLKAASYYSRGNASHLAGPLYEKGVGGKPDLDKALEQYKKACFSGSGARAKKTCAAAGRLLKKDTARSKKFYGMLCQRQGAVEKQYYAAFKKLGGDPASLNSK